MFIRRARRHNAFLTQAPGTLSSQSSEEVRTSPKSRSTSAWESHFYPRRIYHQPSQSYISKFKSCFWWRESKHFPKYLLWPAWHSALDSISASSKMPLWNKERTAYNRSVSQGSEWLRTFFKVTKPHYGRCGTWAQMFGSRDDVLSILTHVILELLQGGVTVGREQGGLQGSRGLTPPSMRSFPLICLHRELQGSLELRGEKEFPCLDVLLFLY